MLTIATIARNEKYANFSLRNSWNLQPEFLLSS